MDKINNKWCLVLLAAMLSLVVRAQENSGLRLGVAMHAEDDRLVEEYMDSLQNMRERIMERPVGDGPCHAVEGVARLFLPVAFYRDVVHRAFSLDAGDGDKELLDIYRNHPYWVETTGEVLRKLRLSSVDIEKPVLHEVDIVDKTVPSAVETENVPVEVLVRRPNFWSYRGEYSLQLLQSYVSGNWYKGGESNYSTIAAVLMEANYNNKQKVKWENRLEMKFGIQSSKSDSLHSYKTTEDLLRLTSKFGLQASKRWYYTFQLVGYSQFTHSYRSNDPKLYADFLAPLNLNLSVGMDYSVDWMNHKLKGNFHLAPLAYNMKYTRLPDLAGRLGIDEGKHFRHDFGSEFTIDLEWKLIDALKWKTRLYGYTAYERAELEWENTFTLAFNRYIGAQLFIYPRFDDGGTRDAHHGYWQFKEFASIGFQYSF